MPEEQDTPHLKPLVFGTCEGPEPAPLTYEPIYTMDVPPYSISVEVRDNTVDDRHRQALEEAVRRLADEIDRQLMEMFIQANPSEPQGDGITDDTAAILRAIDAGLPATRFGGLFLDPTYADEEEEISQGMTLDEWQAWTDQLIREVKET